MRVVHTTVAVNFRELIALESMVQKVLEGLRRVGSGTDGTLSITFSWTDDSVLVRILSTYASQTRSDQTYSERTFDGVDAHQKARLLSLMIQNYLAGGRPFSVGEISGDFDQNYFTMYLKCAA